MVGIDGKVGKTLKKYYIVRNTLMPLFCPSPICPYPGQEIPSSQPIPTFIRVFHRSLAWSCSACGTCHYTPSLVWIIRVVGIVENDSHLERLGGRDVYSNPINPINYIVGTDTHRYMHHWYPSDTPSDARRSSLSDYIALPLPTLQGQVR